jgi:hypothetical protein
MDWQEFVASLVASLAWPAAVVGVALVFRRQIRDLLSTGLHRVKAGPFEAEWQRAEQQVPRSLRLAARDREPDSVESAGATISPRTAVLARHAELVSRLGSAVTAKLGPQPEGQSLGELIDVAEHDGLIDSKTKDALIGLSVMRNLAAHGPNDVTPARASEFMALADAAEYAMEHWLGRSDG